MSVLVRTLLICLMALTLPLQGMASTLSLTCAMAAQSAHNPHSAHHADADHADHADHLMADSGDEHAPHHDEAGPDESATHTHCGTVSHCSLCAAMPPQWGHAALPALDAPAVHLSLHASPPSSVAPEGLERPPRRILA
jgi:uncharacterized protein YceK